MSFRDKCKVVLPVAVFSGVMIGPRLYVLVVAVIAGAIGVSRAEG